MNKLLEISTIIHKIIAVFFPLWSPPFLVLYTEKYVFQIGLFYRTHDGKEDAINSTNKDYDIWKKKYWKVQMNISDSFISRKDLNL